MSVSRTNVLVAGTMPSGSAYDAMEACLPDSSGIFRMLQPLGHQYGIVDGFADASLKKTNGWVSTDIGGAAATSTALTPPTAGVPLLLTLTSGTANSTGRQAQASDGSTTVLAPFFESADRLIHFATRFKFSNLDAGIFLGLAVTDTTIMTTAAAIGVNDGVFLWKDKASATITAYMYRGGVLKQSQILTTVAVADTFYEFGFYFNETQWQIAFRDPAAAVPYAEYGITTVAGDMPNAAMTPSLGIVNGTANSRTLQVQRVCAFQEAA